MKEKEEGRIFIEFGEEHYNPLGVIRSLGEMSIKPVAIIRRGEFGFASKSRYISKLYIVDSIEEGYNILLKNYSNEKLKPVILTTDDQITSFLDKHYEELKDKFIFYNAGSNGRITKYMNKNSINELAVKHGLKIAKSWNVKNGEIPEDIEYPVMTKAIISTINNWKDEVHICNNEAELKNAYKQIDSEEILLQKYIVKKNELCIDGYSIDKGKQVFYAIASNYNNIKKDAYSNYMKVKNCDFPELEKKLSEMFEEIHFEGIFSIEFLIGQDDEYYFLEINFRNSTWSWASTKAGMNLPILWSKSMIDGKMLEDSYKEFKPFNAMAEFNDYKDRVKTKQISKLKWIKQLFGCRCLYFWDVKDPSPVFARIRHKIIKKLKGDK